MSRSRSAWDDTLGPIVIMAVNTSCRRGVEIIAVVVAIVNFPQPNGINNHGRSAFRAGTGKVDGLPDRDRPAAVGGPSPVGDVECIHPRILTT